MSVFVRSFPMVRLFFNLYRYLLYHIYLTIATVRVIIVFELSLKAIGKNFCRRVAPPAAEAATQFFCNLVITLSNVK